jgi:Domain of unknown function (DUF4191)
MARRGKRDKAADDQAGGEAKKQGRLSQIRQAYSMTRKVDPKVGWVTLGAALIPIVVLVGIGLLIGHPIYLGITGVLLGFLAASFIFGRRAERAAYLQVEGQPGAAAAALNLLRRGWTITPGVAVTKSQDIVHRAVGKPGVVLVGEGPPTRVGNLLASEKKKVTRYLPEVPVYDVQAGNGTGQIPLRKLNSHLMKLPRNLNNTQISEVNRRLRALGGMNLPIPKGPMPKNMRMPRGPRG